MRCLNARIQQPAHNVRPERPCSLQEVLLKCKICGNGPLIPMFIGGRPGDRPQRATKAQCDKCGSVLSMTTLPLSPDSKVPPRDGFAE